MSMEWAERYDVTIFYNDMEHNKIKIEDAKVETSTNLGLGIVKVFKGGVLIFKTEGVRDRIQEFLTEDFAEENTIMFDDITIKVSKVLSVSLQGSVEIDWAEDKDVCVGWNSNGRFTF